MGAPRAIRSALALSSEAEKAAILDEFVFADHELEDRAERAARFRLAQVETGEVASAVTAALLALDQEDLAANAGRTRYGYVEPTEAAWLLLEAAVEPWLEDITRRAAVGLTEAARRGGLGILEALQRIRQYASNDDLLVSGRRTTPVRPPTTSHRSSRMPGSTSPLIWVDASRRSTRIPRDPAQTGVVRSTEFLASFWQVQYSRMAL
ncbi:MAG: hypothetical protein JWO74_1249 [Solirubrobacterales bacterium]|jgi:hypothetical protein|nr:hypothetical protein [Solirubrobacterales bacterium]